MFTGQMGTITINSGGNFTTLLGVRNKNGNSLNGLPFFIMPTPRGAVMTKFLSDKACSPSHQTLELVPNG